MYRTMRAASSMPHASSPSTADDAAPEGDVFGAQVRFGASRRRRARSRIPAEQHGDAAGEHAAGSAQRRRARADLHLIDARPARRCLYRHRRRARGLVGAALPEPVVAIPCDERRVNERLGVLHQRRPAEHASFGGVRRSEGRLRRPPLIRRTTDGGLAGDVPMLRRTSRRQSRRPASPAVPQAPA